MRRSLGRIAAGWIGVGLVGHLSTFAHAEAAHISADQAERYVVRIHHQHLLEEQPPGFDACSCDPDGAILFLSEGQIGDLTVPFERIEPLADYVRRFLPIKTMNAVGVPSISQLLHEQPFGGAGGTVAGALHLEYDRYHSPQEGVDFYQHLAAEYPNIARVVSLGTSVEGRELWALKITDDPDAVEPAEQKILFCGVHHAREWATHEVMLYFAEYLLTRYDTDPRIRNIIDRSVVWLALDVNPDGFQYSWDVDRFWRKNRRALEVDVFGVDINRNYNYRWGPGYGGSSGNPNNESYRGPSPASEPETQAMQTLIAAEKPAVAVSFHTYSQLTLYPWGFSGARNAQSYTSLRALGDGYSERVRHVHGSIYHPGPIQYTIYPTNGDFTDYAYGAHGALAYTPELRPASYELGGFLLPEGEILPNIQENLAAALWLMDNVANVRWVAAPNDLFSPGFNPFSLPLAAVNQKPELGVGMEGPFSTYLSTWLDDLYYLAPGYYGYPDNFEGIGTGTAYRYEHNPLSADWADAFDGYAALPYAHEGGAAVMIRNVFPAINIVGVPSDQPVKMTDLIIYQRVIEPVGSTFGFKEVVVESRTALEDLNAVNPWISWTWTHTTADGLEITSHPLGENGADEWIHPFRAYTFFSYVQSYAYGTEPVYLLRFPPPVRADRNGDGPVDGADYLLLHPCLGDPVSSDLPAPCAQFDFDHDFDVDLNDFAFLQGQFGAN